MRSSWIFSCLMILFATLQLLTAGKSLAVQEQIIALPSGAQINKESLIERLVQAGVILLGEDHSNPEHHRCQAEILTSILAAQYTPDLFFEMLSDREEKRYKAFRQQNNIAENVDGLGLALEWEKRGWPIWYSYAPLFKLAARHNLQVQHANLSEESTNNILQFGLLAIPRAQRDAMFPAEKSIDSQKLIEKIKTAVKDAHNLEDQSPYLAGLVFVQLARNAYMALQLSKAEKPVILIAGSEHVRVDCATPLHLKALAPNLDIVSIAFVEAQEVQYQLNQMKSDTGRSLFPFNYVWTTASVTEDQ